ncbi:MAG TPA: hypothetical protein VKS78_10915 [Roseiarcus sp.]|nr:hypothetical protein [Roseiarcus sp.]
MIDVVFARALHVLAVIHWIGGLAFVTLIILPVAATRPDPAEGLSLFAAVEGRFSAQLRFSIPLAGAAGLWMTYRMDLWDRFADPHFWWMSAMVGLWLFFMAMIFVIEPLLHGRFERRARSDPASAFRRLMSLHFVLLALATLTALGAVAGSQGFDFY